MYTREYSLKKDSEKNITPYIKVKEVKCKDGTDYIKMDQVICSIISYAREKFGKPVTITSGYRTANYNSKVDGSATDSRHIKGLAIDHYISGVSLYDLANIYYSFGLIRIKVYNSFLHADTDTSPMWLVNSKGFQKVNLNFLGRNFSVKTNNKDYQVALIQWKLNKLGFNCGSEDSIFGNKTTIAVKSFQKSKGLSQDGVVGINTWNKLFN